jgi:hypothetical protein
MKVALITGSVPPQPCGVGDFSYCLAVALQKQGVRVELVTHRDWRAQAVIGLKREILHWEPDVVHIQYPTLGFGSLLGPQALSMIFYGGSQCMRLRSAVKK